MLGSTSDYGTMSNQIEGLDEDRLEDMIPGLNLGAESQTIFNDISIEERRERIQSILSEIMSVPRLSEATLTHRSTRRDEKNAKSHRGSAMSSIRNGKVSVLRSISTPKLDFIPEKKPEKKKLLKPRLVSKFTAGGGGASGASKKASNLGNDTQNELRFNPPTFGDETTVSNSRASFNDSRTSETSPEQGERPTNFVLENIRSSSAATHKSAGREEPDLPPIKHKSGIVPKYLKARQRQWRDEAQAVIDNTPDVDCPPGHIKLGDEERLNQLQEFKSTHQSLLSDLNKLPVSSDTRRVKEKRAQIETLLLQLEEGIRTYSRPKVFIKQDD